ncbi:STAS domain-containing protein [Telmatospirillum sp. J64-1]|uniref:STAS domain-containing protein n=1 Tax=Telmatospirillum sp. J64-1 TaxID=2502183 RepID=UPI0021024E5A|nr:STAS domain-containing protein [Telmatospirillum sp. J64-1]
MEYSLHENGQVMEVAISGRLTFADHGSFREVVSRLSSCSGGEMVLDLSRVEFIDSAGLGMLLLAREGAENDRVKLTLRGAQGQVKRMLDVARFDSLFILED